jgi:hypothetical protein
MDSRAFDELSKQLGEKTSRGRALKLFGGALVGTLVGAGTARANPPMKHCKFEGYNCQENTDCCSHNCCNRTCCGNGQTCCGGQCVQCAAGQTVNLTTCLCEGATSPPPPPPPPPPPSTCTGDDCLSGGASTCFVNSSGNCYCLPTTEGTSQCVSVAAGCPAVAQCVTSADCPAGQFCSVITNATPGCDCGATVTVTACFPPC